MSIAERFRRIRDSIPETVTIVLAAKTRTASEALEAIEAGATAIGHNYVQELVSMHEALGETASRVRWHAIGHLQKNKINKVLPLADMVQTVDSLETARAIDTRVEKTGKETIDVLLEINSAAEPNKSGLMPEYAHIESVAEAVAGLPHLRLRGLMTMGPLTGNPEDARPFFRATAAFFQRLRGRDRLTESLDTLSMGMSDSYLVAIEEGSTMIRLGTVVFGHRQ
jgi:hypothetical protein